MLYVRAQRERHVGCGGISATFSITARGGKVPGGKVPGLRATLGKFVTATDLLAFLLFQL